MSSHDDHGDQGEHGDAVHGPEPLEGVDGADLHAAVTALAAALHGYVDTAVGVRAEFGSTEADEDPRILALESRIGGLNARLYDLLHERLGLHADLTGLSWGDDADGDADDPPQDVELETFHLGFLVGPPAATSDLSLDSVLDLVEQAGAELAGHLVEAGFLVDGWGASRGAPFDFEEDDDIEDDDDSEDDA